jgi:hypothetical protein
MFNAGRADGANAKGLEEDDEWLGPIIPDSIAGSPCFPKYFVVRITVIAVTPFQSFSVYPPIT